MKEAKRDWYLYQKRADFSELSEKLGIDPVTVRILRNRELHTEEEIRSFLSASLSELPSPLLLPGFSISDKIIIQPKGLIPLPLLNPSHCPNASGDLILTVFSY